MSGATTDWPRAGIQTLVALGYRLHRSRHFLLHVEQPEAARAWLVRLLERGWLSVIESLPGEAEASGCRLNLGFSQAGLRVLGLPQALLGLLRERAPAFAQGAPVRAAQRLADSGPSAADNWEDGFALGFAHVLVNLHADSEEVIRERAAALRELAGPALSGWDAPQDGCHLAEPGDMPIVHFGYRDGIARVVVQGIGGRGTPHPPGEVLLGHDNGAGFNRWRFGASAPADAAAFFHNGSFAAFRKMAQDERRFRERVQAWADALGVSREYVMAKLCGRWPSGEPMLPGERVAPPPPEGGQRRPRAEIDDFDFRGDSRGQGCPFGAHIRRMNPRADPVVPPRKRPLVRRGMPYGPLYDGASAGADAPAKVERGLLGLFFCASLEDQFEHLLAEWGNRNPMGPDVRGNAKDPLIGNHEDTRDLFDIPMADGSTRRLDGFAPYVVTRGTLYAFYPSRGAVEMLARSSFAKAP